MPDDLPDAVLVSRIRANVERVRDRIARAASDTGRDPASVRLLVATKTQPLAAVRAAVAAGVDLVGENRVQELVAKAPALHDDVAAGRLRTHLIGHLQANKVNAVVGLAACVETVDSLALAQRLSRRAETVGADLEVMVQVNVSGEASKSGAAPDAATGLALEVASLPRIHLVGFMTIGARTSDDTTVRRGFALLRDLRDDVRGQASGTSAARELSMGMSGDLELAVTEGATVVRVGTAVFGERA
ncbi:YggS family pyridoxal phosphate-dependent enzyme [Luteimicrobium sp. DT211]|uniref:YggS family pyridoxal phosphate-dependent enzyme n=1 Tax=Luteimicrobium sp. DT211 TaxID=3393412 RepID=UPI003CE984C9